MRPARELLRRECPVQDALGLLQRTLRAAERHDRPRVPCGVPGRRHALRPRQRLLLARLQHRRLRRRRVPAGRVRLRERRPVLLERLRRVARRQVRSRSRRHLPTVGRELHRRRWQSLLRGLRRHDEAVRSGAGALSRAWRGLRASHRLLPRDVRSRRDRPHRVHRAASARRHGMPGRVRVRDHELHRQPTHVRPRGCGLRPLRRAVRRGDTVLLGLVQRRHLRGRLHPVDALTSEGAATRHGARWHVSR
jgi:hypothetical protein